MVGQIQMPFVMGVVLSQSHNVLKDTVPKSK